MSFPTYDLSFNYAAVGVYLVLMISYICKKRAEMWETTLFIVLLSVSFLSTVADILCSYAHMHLANFSQLFTYVTTVAYFVFHNTTSCCFAVYIISMSEKNYLTLPFWKKILFLLPICIIIVLVCVSCVTGLIFYFDSNGVYHRGPLQIVLYIVSAFYILSGIFYTFIKQILPIKDSVLIAVTLLGVTAGASVFQLFHESVLIENFAVALCVLIVLVLIHRPEDYIDSQVSVFNVKTFSKQFKSYVSRKHALSVVIMYIEDMKLINSVIGLESALLILNHVARYLELIAERRVFYLESYTFAVILPGRSPAAIGRFITRVEERFLREWNDGKKAISLTNRFMTVNVPDDTDDISTLFAYADYVRSLDSSRHWVLFAKDVALKDSRRYFEVESRIKNAVSDSAFEVFYQPIVDAVTEQVVSAEALIRLADHGAEYLSPAEFIPMAEQNGEILQIGEILFEEVCRFIRKNDLQHLGLHYIEINLSVVQCIQDHMAEYFLQILKNYHIDPHFINLEITETAAINSPRALIKNITKLHSHGVSFSLDDFGTGYTTINSLLELPLSIVKFDKSMTDSATESQKGRIILSSSIAMIKKMGMNIVSEGIETEEQVTLFKSMGVDYFQGYFFSKPVPAQQFVSYAERVNGIKQQFEVLEEL